jgi:alkanesulfonate monooxygenase SsuD/methylene tetrahydromethanopterin reductase-like flavin-dependent oxidoreductase (luciferase family)
VVKRWFDGYRSAANDLGFEPDPEKLALSIPVYVAETDEQAHAESRQHIEWLYHKGLKQGLERVMAPGYTSLSSLRGMRSACGKAPNEYSCEEIIDHGMAVVGSPDTVGERFESLRDELGFGQIISLVPDHLARGRGRHAPLPDGQEHGALRHAGHAALRGRSMQTREAAPA